MKSGCTAYDTIEEVRSNKLKELDRTSGCVVELHWQGGQTIDFILAFVFKYYITGNHNNYRVCTGSATRVCYTVTPLGVHHGSNARHTLSPIDLIAICTFSRPQFFPVLVLSEYTRRQSPAQQWTGTYTPSIDGITFSSCHRPVMPNRKSSTSKNSGGGAPRPPNPQPGVKSNQSTNTGNRDYNSSIIPSSH